MALEISYFFLFGFVVTLTNGKPADKGSLNIDLLKSLLNHQGTYDIDLSHHEDGPKTHHEDSIHISRHGDDAPAYEASRENHGKQDNYLTLGDVDSLNQQLDGKPVSVIRSDINNGLYSALSRDEKCNKLANCTTVNFIRDMIRNDNNKYVNVDELPKSHNKLIKNLYYNIGSYDSESRCEGNRCGRYRSNRDSNRSVRDYLRCIGNRCSLNDDRYRNKRDDLRILSNGVSWSGRSREERDNLLCIGNRCGRNRDDYNRDDTNNRVCIGNRCGRDREDYKKDDSNNLLCTGNTCGGIRENYNRDDMNNRILCIGNRCGRVRGDNKKDDSNNLLCTGNRCGRNGEDYNRDDMNNRILCIGNRCGRVREDFNENDANNLLCTGNRCGRIGEDYNNDDYNNLRCIEDRCSRNKEDYYRDNTNNLLCIGERCGRNIIDYNRYDAVQLRCSGKSCKKSSKYGDENVELKELPKIYKEIETVLSEIADIERFLKKYNL